MMIVGSKLEPISLLVFIAFCSSYEPALAQQRVNVSLCGPVGLPQPTDPLLEPMAPGKIPGQFGPYDYRTVTPAIRHRVEDYHFTMDVESGVKGSTSATAGSDLDYTMRAFPNNPRALFAVSKYAMRMKSEHPSGLRYTAECYYERAIRFVADDPMPHLLYGAYLNQRKRSAEVRAQLDEAERLRGEPTNSDFDYNLGLLYFDIGAYDQAMKAATRAYALGAPFPALEKKLRSVGKWRGESPASKDASEGGRADVTQNAPEKNGANLMQSAPKTPN